MTLAVVRSRGLAGMSAPEVSVEVHLANGLPAFTLVGLPDTEVREALSSLGYSSEEIRAVLRDLPTDGDVQLLLRDALGRLARA